MVVIWETLVVVDTVIIFLFGLLLRRRMDTHGIWPKRTASCREDVVLKLVTSRPSERSKHVTLAAESVCIIVRSRCVASFQVARMLTKLDLAGCPWPWVVAVVNEGDSNGRLDDMLTRSKVPIIRIRLDSLRRIECKVPMIAVVPAAGQFFASSVSGDVHEIARLIETSGSVKLRHWFLANVASQRERGLGVLTAVGKPSASEQDVTR